MGDDRQVMPPVTQFGKQLPGGGGALGTVRGQVGHVHTLVAGPCQRALERVARKVLHPLVADESERHDGTRSEIQRLQQIGGASRGGLYRSRRDFIVRQPAQDDVLVAPVVLHRAADLGPLPAQEGHGVGIVRVLRARIAVADGLDGLAPAPRCQEFRVIVDRPEIQRRAVACEVAGVRLWVGALASHEIETGHEGVHGQGGVGVEVAEQNLRVRGYSQLRVSGALSRLSLVDDPGRHGLALDDARTLVAAKDACADRSSQQQDQQQ